VGRRVAANRKKLAELEVAQKEQFERQKEEMMGTLKDVGNKVGSPRPTPTCWAFLLADRCARQSATDHPYHLQFLGMFGLGLSTDNFEMNEQPGGGYFVNFNQNPGGGEG